MYSPLYGSSALCVGPKGWAQTSGSAHDLGIRGSRPTSGPPARRPLRGPGSRSLVVTTGLHESGGAWRSAVPGGDGGDFVHSRHRFGGTLYTAGQNQCTNPRPYRAASVQGRTLRTGRYVPTGLCTLPKSGWGLCTLEASFRRDFVHCWRGPVYKPQSEQGRQCTKSDFAHRGRSGGGSREASRSWHHGSAREFRRHFAGTDPHKAKESPLLSNGDTSLRSRVVA